MDLFALLLDRVAELEAAVAYLLTNAGLMPSAFGMAPLRSPSADCDL
jgi:hypothetical protein